MPSRSCPAPSSLTALLCAVWWRWLWRITPRRVKHSARAWSPCGLASPFFAGWKWRVHKGVVARSEECDAPTGRERLHIGGFTGERDSLHIGTKRGDKFCRKVTRP
ncbi:hypothetical protein EPR50_G00149040 [Perca flavescens]|uniref:Uncharacterized protein n=1 Tax=Perca flavescens TaxID=8167 RepID=A0A484CQ98_PERFV|nr:hypothetical protein EPR50_G00149040 [Perca flavescens]